MATLGLTSPPQPIVYPDSDGQPMADNTLQFDVLTTLKWWLDNYFIEDSAVFVAGDLLWYPVEGDSLTRAAPDTLVAFGRPKGYRGSYKQWEEGGIAPQVVFEILSPNVRRRDMQRKFLFYEQYGVEEYYVFDPDSGELTGWLRRGDRLQEIPRMQGCISPRLGLRFEVEDGRLELVAPDGRRMTTYVELSQQRDALAQQRDQLAQQRDAERERAERLAARLRDVGVEPD